MGKTHARQEARKKTFLREEGVEASFKRLWEDSGDPVEGLVEEKHFHLGPKRQLFAPPQQHPTLINSQRALPWRALAGAGASKAVPAQWGTGESWTFWTNSLRENPGPDTESRGELCWRTPASRMWPTPTSIDQSYWSILTLIHLHMKEWELEVEVHCLVYIYWLWRPL